MFLLVSGRHVGAHPDRHQHTPIYPVVARDKLCESEACWASVFWLDNASPKRCCFVGDLVCFIIFVIFIIFFTLL